MGCITLVLDTDQFSSGADDIEQLAEDIQAFINILHHAGPDYIEAGNLLQRQLEDQMEKLRDKSNDPKEKMQKYLDNIAPDIIDGRVADLNALYFDLRNSIGEAMGPVSYAAYTLATKLKDLGQPSEWVWDFVKYYEDHWEF